MSSAFTGTSSADAMDLPPLDPVEGADDGGATVGAGVGAGAWAAGVVSALGGACFGTSTVSALA